MNIVVRKFSACPVRTAANTWEVIVKVIAGSSAEAKSELLKIAGIAASVISDESPEKDPIIIIGTGSRLRIYCLYDEDGSTEDANESALTWNLFANHWEIYFPTEKDELDWVRKALTEKGTKFKAYETGTKPLTDEDENNNSPKAAQQLVIDISKL